MIAVLLFLSPPVHGASSWSPTLLVNTEAFQVIDDTDAASDVVIQFGQTLGKRLIYNRSAAQFEFNDDLEVAGTVSGSNLTFMGALNSYILGSLGIGKSSAPNTKLEVVGTISGSALTTINLVNSVSAASGSILVSRTSRFPEWKPPTGAAVWFLDGAAIVTVPQGAQVTMPFGVTATSVNLQAAGAPTGAALIVDIRENGTTLFSTKPQINASATTGGGSAVFSDTSIAAGSVLTVGITQAGSTFAGSGITIQLNGIRKY